MDYDKIIETTNRFLIEEFEVEESEIEPDKDLKETLDLDSLDYVDLVVVIENNFGFKVNGEDFKEIATFKDFYDYISKRLESKMEI